jgi:alkylhydroperoxidase family enzyme
MSELPRIDPLEPGQWRDDLTSVRDLVPAGTETPMGFFHIFQTFARHPDLFRVWLPFGGYLLGGGRLPARDRELLILRTAVRCGSSYEWGQHVQIAARLGIDRDAVDRVVAGSGAEGWSEHDAALLRAVDELHDASVLSDETWSALAASYDEQQLIEVPMLVGQYHMVAFTLNSVGVQLDDGLEGLPAS